MNKENLRQDILHKLHQLSSEELYLLNRSLTNQIIKLLQMFPDWQSQLGAAYLPFKTEIAPVFQELLRAVPVNLAYPVLLHGEMGFGVTDGLPKGVTWLSEPYHEVRPEWALIPGIAFDLKGSRLGRGKGFYDRYLNRHEIIKIGLCSSGQLLEEIPVEAHDHRMNYIITEKFCWDVTQQKRL